MTDLVPFGKHKGKPVEVLLADSGYREWVLAQPWVRDRYPTFHQTIINYGGEPAETPEHNELQASFLDDNRCVALAELLFPAGVFNGNEAQRLLGRRVGPYSSRTAAEILEKVDKRHVKWSLVQPWISGRAFEVDGWDVVFSLHPTSLHGDLVSLPFCSCVCHHDRDCPANSTCRGGDVEHRCNHRHSERKPVPTFEQWHAASEQELARIIRTHSHSYAHCDETCAWGDDPTTEWLLDDEARVYRPMARRVRVECKPDLGDDFPAVLRQVTRYEAGVHGDRRCVVVRRAAFESVTWAQVTEMFRASDVVLVDESRIGNAGDVPANERSTT